MSEIQIIPATSAIQPAGAANPLPLPSVPITIRPGVLSDVPFLDSLQKLHTKQVGWMPTKQFEGKIKAGHVLVAEELPIGDCPLPNEHPQSAIANRQSAIPVGYCIGNDQYFKRDDVGIIYQMNVLPGRQRGFVGASLLKAQFERSAYGCKLYCCWCAQDIAANFFWESMGFVPLAFRTGSEKKSRVHIFWQKRIRQGDASTPWWFPSKTNGGSIREDRIVLPIPPGTHWSDAKPLVLPGQSAVNEVNGERRHHALNHDATTGTTEIRKSSSSVPRHRDDAKHSAGLEEISVSALRFAPAKAVKPSKEKPRREKAVNDPNLVAAARELRDRWLEQVNAGVHQLAASGKYEVGRSLEGSIKPAKQLTAA